VGGSGSPAYCDGTTWVNGSDRNSKENFAALDAQTVLAKVAALPLTEWNYKTDPADHRHIGPMAQDFHAAFGLNGGDNKHISTVDEGGVALAAIQGLNQKVEAGSQQSKVRIQKLEAENAELKARLEKLEQLINNKNGGDK
jgi:Chaperone of endosialidase